MTQTKNTENKLFTTLMATFVFLMLASFTTKDGYSQNIKEQAETVHVTPSAISEIDPNMPVVYVVGKRLPKDAS